MGVGKKMTKGMIGGGVNISHKSKMSNAAKNQMSFPGGMPGPGEYGMQEGMPKIVGKGMMKYMAGEPVGMKAKGTPLYGKKKSTPLYGEKKSMPLYGKKKSMPLYDKKKSMPEYGEGPEKALVGKQKNLPEELKKEIEAAPGMYGKKKQGPPKTKGEKGGLKTAQRLKAEKEKKELNKQLETSPISGKKYAASVSREQRLRELEESKKGPKLKYKTPKDFSDLGKKFKGGKMEKKSMSDTEKIKASKAKKQADGNKKASDAAKELKAAKESKFISRGSGEDSGIETRQGRRKKIRAARKKGREGRREVRKAKRKTVIKQKI